MSDYPQYPTDSANSMDGPPSRGARPAAVDTAVKLIWANIALSLITTLVTFVMLDSLVDRALDDAGVQDSVDADTVRIGFIIGAIVVLIISVALFALLAHFIGKGANWARIVFTVLSVLGILFSFAGFGSQTGLLLVLGVLSLALTVGALFLLWKQESNAWFKAR